MSVQAQEAANAINKILEFNLHDDQKALLDVLDMYFCGPRNPSCSESNDASLVEEEGA